MSLEKDEEVVIFEAYLAGSANIFKNCNRIVISSCSN